MLRVKRFHTFHHYLFNSEIGHKIVLIDCHFTFGTNSVHTQYELCSHISDLKSTCYHIQVYMGLGSGYFLHPLN